MTIPAMSRAPRPILIDPEAVELEPLALDPEDFQSPLPVQNYHSIYADDEIGLAVGIWDTTTMQEAFGPYPTDEFITVLEGSFSILDAGGQAVSGRAGESATFRNAIPVSWKQEGYLRKIYLTLVDPEAAVPEIASADGGVIILDGKASALGPPAGAWVIFRNDTGTMTVEHRIHPGHALPAAPAQMHELCRVLSGEMILTDDQGGAMRLGANGHVFIPKGALVARQFAEGTEVYHVLVNA